MDGTSYYLAEAYWDYEISFTDFLGKNGKAFGEQWDLSYRLLPSQTLRIYILFLLKMNCLMNIHYVRF